MIEAHDLPEMSQLCRDTTLQFNDPDEDIPITVTNLIRMTLSTKKQIDRNEPVGGIAFYDGFQNSKQHKLVEGIFIKASHLKMIRTSYGLEEENIRVIHHSIFGLDGVTESDGFVLLVLNTEDHVERWIPIESTHKTAWNIVSKAASEGKY